MAEFGAWIWEVSSIVGESQRVLVWISSLSDSGPYLRLIGKERKKKKKKTGGTKVYFIFWESPNQLSAPVLLAALEDSNIWQRSEGRGAGILQERAGGEEHKRARGSGASGNQLGRTGGGGRRMKLQRGEKTYKQEEKINKTCMTVHRTHPWIYERFPWFIKAFLQLSESIKQQTQWPTLTALPHSHHSFPDTFDDSRLLAGITLFLSLCWSITCRWDVKQFQCRLVTVNKGCTANPTFFPPQVIVLTYLDTSCDVAARLFSPCLL